MLHVMLMLVSRSFEVRHLNELSPLCECPYPTSWAVVCICFSVWPQRLCIAFVNPYALEMNGV